MKGWYLRDLIAQLERVQGAEAVFRLRNRLSGLSVEQLDRVLPPSLPPSRRDGFSTGRLRPPYEERPTSDADSLPLAIAEEVLLVIDGHLGDGSGRLLESLSQELTARVLSQGSGVIVPGDLIATMARLRVVVERPFGGAQVEYRVTPTDLGFNFTVGVDGHPRSTRILRYLAAGVVRAAHRYGRAVGSADLRIYGDTTANRSNLTVQLRSASLPPPPMEPEYELAGARAPSGPQQRRPSSSGLRAITQPSLAAEVDRIMSSRRRDTLPPPPAPTSPGTRRPTAPPPAPSEGTSEFPSLRAPRVPKV